MTKQDMVVRIYSLEARCKDFEGRLLKLQDDYNRALKELSYAKRGKKITRRTTRGPSESDYPVYP